MQAARQAVYILYRCHAIQHKHCVVNHDIQLAVDVDALHDVTHAHTHTRTQAQVPMRLTRSNRQGIA
jgi:hypothetical protein